MRGEIEREREGKRRGKEEKTCRTFLVRELVVALLLLFGKRSRFPSVHLTMCPQALREKYGITDAMVNFAPVEIIETPKYGRLAAITACEEVSRGCG